MRKGLRNVLGSLVFVLFLGFLACLMWGKQAALGLLAFSIFIAGPVIIQQLSDVHDE